MVILRPAHEERDRHWKGQHDDRVENENLPRPSLAAIAGRRCQPGGKTQRKQQNPDQDMIQKRRADGALVYVGRATIEQIGDVRGSNRMDDAQNHKQYAGTAKKRCGKIGRTAFQWHGSN